MVVLNWKTGIGNITLDPGSSILVPFQDLPGLRPVPLPADTIAQPDEYGIYFKVESIDPLTSAVVFKVDSDGFKIPFGFTPYTTGNLTDDDLAVIGYPPEAREDGTYVNALNLTTIRLGGGNDTFTLTGKGITQSPSAEVSKEASQGYIFQSNIFAGSGDDVVRVLMPWQSVFKGGSNTPYYDAIFGTDPGGGTAITLSDDLTLEEMSFGDLIELKGSRFDWDIEFKDGNGDGDVNLASILDERDYIAVSNNNRIYGFERLLFGDILFDLVLARQQDSNWVYGQPDYYLNGSEDKAPELNSTISQGSGLWEAFRFNRTKLEGITGTATNPISVHTGNAGDTPFLVGALRFASLQTEDGDDIAEIGSADQATVDLGEGSDQLKANVAFSRSTAVGGAGDDNIILTSISNSTISGGSGADIVDVRASATDSAFDGGADAGDTLLLPGPFADYALSASNSGGVVTFTDAFGNNFTGFQSIKFSDINLDALQTLSLTGPAAPVAEGATADYTIALGASGLGASGLARGESVAFTLQLGNGTAQVSSDLAALVQSSLQAAAGIVLRNVSVDAGTGLIRAVASASRDFSPAATIATLALPVSVDLQTEPDETFSVTLTDFVQAQTVTTTISNVLPVTIRLSGPTSVTEGQTASYAVGLDGVGLAAGRSATFVLDSIGGTATEGQDFAALIASSLQKADGITLSGISAAADGAVTVTATNTSGGDLAVGATLLTVSLPITTDATVEGTERFSITLASSTAVVSGALVTTTISDLVPTPTLALSGVTAATEGKSAAYAVALAGSSSDLLAGQSITLTLDSASGSATENLDFAALISAGLTAGNGITFGAIATDPVSGAVTLTATNTSGGSLAARSQLLSFSVAAAADAIAETDEAFTINLTSSNASVSGGSISTTIRNVGGLIDASTTKGSNSLSPAQWIELNGAAPGAPHFEGIAGSEKDPILVSTGDTDDSIRLNDAIAFATLDTGGGKDLIQVLFPTPRDSVTPFVQFGHGAYKATIRTGDGNDVINIQSFENSEYIRSTPQDPPAYNRPDYYDSIVDAGSGNDYVYGFLPYKTQFLGGDGIDTLFLYGRYSDWSVQKIDPTGDGLELSDASSDFTTWNASTSLSNTAIENTVRGFEFIQFNDILLDLVERLNITPAAAVVDEGSTAAYGIDLAGDGLQQGQSVAFSLQLSNGSAQFATDLAALAQSSLQGVNGIALQDVNVDAATGMIRGVASATKNFSAGSRIVNLTLPALADLIAETNEDFDLTLGGFIQPQTVTTTIRNRGQAVIRLSGPSNVLEGATTASFTVSLGNGIGLGAGASVTFTIDSASGTATEGPDFAALTAAGLTAATGLSLSPISIDPATGAITITATNTSGADLAAGSALVSFGINTTNDLISEANESFSLNLTDSPGVTVEGPASLTTSITDDDAPALKLNVTGASSLAEGANASYSLALDGVGLGVGRSVSFTLDSASGTAAEGVDFAALIAAALTAASGITLSAISTAANGTITATATNTSGADLPVGSSILSFSLAANSDSILEGTETYSVSLGGANGSGSITTAINDTNTAVISLGGSASVLEGANAGYAVSLDGVGLSAGQSITLTLDSASGSATENLDFAALISAGLTAGNGITFGAIATDPVSGAVTLTATNTSTGTLAAGSQLLSISIPTTGDSFAEGSETFSVSLTSTNASVSTGSITTSITDNDPLAVRITGPATVAEGTPASPYTVSLGSAVGLGAGRSVTFSLDSASGSATEGLDFNALVAAGLTAATGISLSNISTAANGSITVTASNSSGADLAAGSALLSFGVATTNDQIVEANESFSLNLTGPAGVTVEGPASLTTSITDANAPALKLTGASSVAEGANASYSLALDGVGLGAGRSVSFTLDSASGTAAEGSDFATLIAANLQPVAGVSLSNISTDVLGGITGRATNTGSDALAVNAELLSFSIAATADAVAEQAETYDVFLSSTDAAVSTASFTTSITDASLPVFRLTGSTAVTEGSLATYGVSLDGGIALGAGKSVTFTLDSQGLGDVAGLSATQGKDLAALVAAMIKPTPAGITLSNISTDPATGAITLTATNSSPVDLAAGSQIVSFELPTTNDLFVEGNETFRVSLTSTTATVTGADLTTTINDDDTPVIKLTGSDTVAEAVTAAYAVSLDGVGLGAGASVSFSLDSAGITATEGSDFAALVAGSLVAASAQLGLSTNPPSASGAVSVTITNNGADLAAGSKLLDIALPTTGDVLVEGQEIFALTLSSTTATVSAATINTTITDDDVAAISLNGPASVSEGAAASYTLALAGIGLGAGRSLTFSLDTASGAGAAGATEGTDFAALLASSLTPAAGISLSGISTAADGTVTLTVTNTSGAELWAGSALLNFDVATTQDAVAEASETLNVSLGGSNGTAALTTTITDNDPAAIRLTGAASVLEGANASYAVSLDGVGLGAGQSLTLTLDSASGTALETVDFAALIGSSLTAATGVSLSGLSTGALGAITLTATNTSGNDLDLGAQLLSFTIAASTDAGAETDETFEVTLSSSTASVASGAGLVTTTIENIGGLISRVTTQGADTLSPSQWLELNGEEPNAPPFAGITGSEKNPITVNTGDIANSVWLSDAIAFATLNTGADNDRVLVAFPPSRDLPYVQFGHGAYKATINTGAGNDVINIQSAANSAYVRSTPQDPPSYALPDYYDSIVDAGEGDDYVYGFLPYKTQFIGGSSTDTLFLYGRYSDWSVQTVDVTANGLLLSDASDDYSTWSAATTLSNTATENTVRGFEFVQFNDILLDLSEQLTLAGPASPVAEGASASYSIALAGNGLQQSQSVAFSLQLSDGTARLAADLAALTPSVLQGANGVSLQNVVVDATTGRITAVATATRSFSSGATIASLALPVQADLLAEPDETFNLTLGGFIQPQSVITTISNQDPLAIRLTGPGSVLEGATTTPYTVALDGVGLGAGASVSFSLDSASGSATEGLDFNALVAAGLTAATGITLSGITTAADGSIAVTATNTSGVDLITDAALLTLKIKTANDAVVEGDESFDLRLSSSSTAVSSATLSTTITDDDAPALKLTGSASIAEGAAASYSLALDGVGLGAGRSVTFTLDSASGSAAEGSDFSELAFADLKAGAGVKLKRLSTDPLTKAVTISATNVSGTDLATGAELLSVPIKTTNDRTAEGEETYVVNLSSNTVSVAAPALTTKIKDDDPVAIRLKGKTSVREGDAASYAIGLDGVGLGSGRSISLSVNTAGESARQPTDFAALLPGALSPEAGVSLSGISTDPVTGALTLTMTNSSGEDLAANAQLLNVSIGTSDDTVVEGNETYAVNISKSTAALNGDTINTTITDDDTPVIKLTGSSTVQEGNTAAYEVSLDGVSLGAGQSLKLVLDTISGSATEGSDFAALVAAGLKAAPGLKLSDISIQASTKAVRLTVTNRSNTDLAVGAPLLSFTLNTIDDTTVEVTESYRVTLTSSTADVSSGSLTTTITDNDIATPVEPPSGGGGGNPASPGNQFLNGGKPEDILDSIFGKGRPRVRRKAAADPIVESRQRLMDTRSRRSADRTQNVAAMDDSTAISSIGSAVTVVTAPWQDPRLDGTTALPLGRSDNGTLQWL